MRGVLHNLKEFAMSKGSASAMVRGAGMAADVWGKLDEAVRAKGGTEDALHRLARDEGNALIDLFADILVKAELETRNRFAVTVDYATPLAEQITDGKYGYVNEYITSANFPLTGTGTKDEEIILVHFDRVIESDDAVKELAAMGLEPAKLEHATAFGAKYPDVQLEYPIVFLGSPWESPRGFRHVPYLDIFFVERRLCLYAWDIAWKDSCRFAAVRKVPAPAL